MLTNFERLSHVKRIQALLGIGSAFVLCACIGYLFSGFNTFIFVFWLLGIAVCGWGLFSKRRPFVSEFSVRDVLTLFALTALALPCYVWSVYSVPFQVNSDELVLVGYERQWIDQGRIDIFGLSEYYGFTSFPFLLQGWLGSLLGGIDLYHQRLLHALGGVIIVACSYVFFRVLGMRWLLAIAATAALGINHSLLAINRMAARINSGLMVELIALTILLDGIRRRCPFTTYVGGLFMGLCFYVYYSARLTLPIWLAFLVMLACFRRREYPVKQLINLSAYFILGFSLCALPLATATIRDNQNFVQSLDYLRHQSLLYSEGRVCVMHDFSKKTIEEGVMQNVINGLTVFNNTVEDHGGAYPNPSHGFVDPLSGMLVWIGFLYSLIYLHGDLAVLLIVCGLLLDLLFFGLMATNAPTYHRLLIILPFFAYLVARGIEAISSYAGNLANKVSVKFGKCTYSLFFLMLTCAVVAWNCFIFNDFVKFGFEHGDDIGGTARYMEARRAQPNHLFIIATGPEFLYYYYGGAIFEDWKQRARVCLTPEQQFRVISADDVGVVRIVPPFSIFMNGKLWALKKGQLTKMYPNLEVHKISDVRGLVAVEDASVSPYSVAAHDAYRHWYDYLSTLNSLRSGSRYEDIRAGCLDALKSPEALANGSYFKSQILFNLGVAYMELKEYSQAATTLEETFRLCEKQEGYLFQAAAVASFLGDLYSRQKQWAKAEEWYRTSAEVRERAGRNDAASWVADLPQAYRCIGKVCWEQKKYSDAEQNLQHAIDLCPPDYLGTERKAAYAKELALCKKDESDSRH
jgi:tetratricopeptide (TPR) repeat protein